MISISAYVQRVIDHNDVEARIALRIYNALELAGNPVKYIDYGEGPVDVNSLNEFMQAVFSVDECYIYANRGWIRFIIGNEWDCLVDYTLNLEEALAPVDSYIRRHW